MFDKLMSRARAWFSKEAAASPSLRETEKPTMCPYLGHVPYFAPRLSSGEKGAPSRITR